jgi:hypothetical protein
LPSVRIGADSAGLAMSPDEFDAITEYDNSVNYELINGVLVVTPMPSRFERSANELLGYWLRTYQEQHVGGNCLIDIVFNDYLHTRDNRCRAGRSSDLGRPR